MRAAALLFACLAPLLAGSEDSFALRNITIHPVSAPEIAAGTLVVVDGRIAALGASAAVPRGLRVIDGKGLHVYPGIIDSLTQIGLSEISAVPATVDTTEVGDFNPQLRAEIAINPASEHIPVTRAAGITSVIAGPMGGIISGQAALVHLDGWTWEEMDIRRSAAMMLTIPVIQAGGGRGSAPGRPSFAEARRNYEKKLAELRDFFEAARRYRQARLAGQAGFKTDLKFEAMLPVLEGKVPVVARATRERAIREALKLAGEQKIRLILAGPREVEGVVKEIREHNIPVILGPTHVPPLNEDDPYDRSFTLPGELYKAGIKLAFASFSTSGARNLPEQVATAVAYGLPYQEGLKALTLNAAEIWGVASEYGSIAKGKWADLMVTDGDPLETRTQVKHLFIKGRAVDLDNKHRRLYQKYLARP